MKKLITKHTFKNGTVITWPNNCDYEICDVNIRNQDCKLIIEPERGDTRYAGGRYTFKDLIEFKVTVKTPPTWKQILTDK